MPITNNDFIPAIKLRMGRAAIGLTQQALADITGVAKSTIARIETLESKGRPETLELLLGEITSRGVNIIDNADVTGFTIEITQRGIDRFRINC